MQLTLSCFEISTCSLHDSFDSLFVPCSGAETEAIDFE